MVQQTERLIGWFYSSFLLILPLFSICRARYKKKKKNTAEQYQIITLWLVADGIQICVVHKYGM